MYVYVRYLLVAYLRVLHVLYLSKVLKVRKYFRSVHVHYNYDTRAGTDPGTDERERQTTRAAAEDPRSRRAAPRRTIRCPPRRKSPPRRATTRTIRA